MVMVIVIVITMIRAFLRGSRLVDFSPIQTAGLIHQIKSISPKLPSLLTDDVTILLGLGADL
jgi:hypothetical protein